MTQIFAQEQEEASGERLLWPWLEEACGRGRMDRAWVKHPGFRALYVRYIPERHVVGYGRIAPVLDLASMEVESPRRGTLRCLVGDLREAYPSLALYVESVSDVKGLGRGLVRMGFREVNRIGDISANYLWRLP